MRVTVSVDTSAYERWVNELGDQMPFAQALALTRTAQDAASDLAKALPEYLDKPTPWTARAFAVRRADKRTLAAEVYVKPGQSYLGWQIEGGTRAPARKALKLPGSVKLDQSGNIPRAELQRLIQTAKEGKRLTKARARRLGISAKVDLFYGDPGNGMPPGLYKRIVAAGEHHLVPLVLFPHRSARYRKRLPMADIVRRTVARTWQKNFGDAAARALASAR